MERQQATDPEYRLRMAMKRTAVPGKCYFGQEWDCNQEYDCKKCEHLPRDLYTQLLNRMAARKTAFKPILRPPEISCKKCGKIIGAVYPEPTGAYFKEGGFGKDDFAYCNNCKEA